MASGEAVNTSGVIAKHKQQKKEISLLKKQIQQLEEEKLELRMQIHKQKQMPEQSEIDSARSQDEGISTKDQIRALVEENEALRKGMHEIMNSLNTRKGTQRYMKIFQHVFNMIQCIYSLSVSA